MKRFTETTKWSNNPWYRKLSPTHKCLWNLLCETCDAAGVIEPDWELISFQIGDPVSAADLTHFGKRIVTLGNGKLWLTKFISFQYGTISPDCRPHQAIFRSIASNSIPYPSNTQAIGYPNPSERVEEEDKDKDKDQDRTEEGSGEKPNPSATPPPLDPVAIASLYPRRERVQDAVTHIARHIAAGVDRQTIIDGTRAIAAIIQQLPSGALNAYVPSAANFFKDQRWNDDPQTWLRNAGKNSNGAAPPKPSLGGRAGTTIRIGS